MAHFIGTPRGTVLHNPSLVQVAMGVQSTSMHGAIPYERNQGVNNQTPFVDLTASPMTNGRVGAGAWGHTQGGVFNNNNHYFTPNHMNRSNLYGNAENLGAYTHNGFNVTHGVNVNVVPNVFNGTRNGPFGGNVYPNALQHGAIDNRNNAHLGLGGMVNGPNPVTTPLVTNEGHPTNANFGALNYMGGWNGNASMVTQAPLASHTQVPLTPADKEVKELREMLVKFMNKDGVSLQALSFQDMAILPQKFKMPEIKRFDGTGCPFSHLKSYTLAMKTRGATDQMMATSFSLTLEGSAQEWIMSLEPSVLIDWEKVSDLFQKRYIDNSKHGNDKKELKNFCMKKGESFTEFAKRWKDKVAQTLERPTKEEEVDMFLNNLRPFYFHKMVCGGYSGFDALMAAGLRIEECLRLGTMKDDTPSSGSSHGYLSNMSGDGPKATDANLSSNSVSNVTWSPQKAQIPYNYDNGGQTRKKGARLPRTYDVLPDSQENIFRLLKERGLAKSLEGWKPRINPLPPQWDHEKHCEYHNHSGHDTEGCIGLKNYLQDLIEEGKLERGV